jgi:hypothetical protein
MQARWTQAIAIQNRADLFAVGEGDAGRAVPRPIMQAWYS